MSKLSRPPQVKTIGDLAILCNSYAILHSYCVKGGLTLDFSLFLNKDSKHKGDILRWCPQRALLGCVGKRSRTLLWNTRWTTQTVRHDFWIRETLLGHSCSTSFSAFAKTHLQRQSCEVPVLLGTLLLDMLGGTTGRHSQRRRSSGCVTGSFNCDACWFSLNLKCSLQLVSFVFFHFFVNLLVLKQWSKHIAGASPNGTPRKPSLKLRNSKEMKKIQK